MTLIQFDADSGGRIADVVRFVESQANRQRPLTFSPLLEQRAVAGSAFRVCTFSGAWPKNATKVVTYKYQTATPNTATALNLFANIGTSMASVRNCAISREGTAWFLIAAECD